MSPAPMLLAAALAFAGGSAAKQILETDVVEVDYFDAGDATCAGTSPLKVAFDLCCPCFRWSFDNGRINDVSATRAGDYTLGDDDFKWLSHITSDNCAVGNKGVANKHADTTCIRQTEGIAYNCKITKITPRNGTCAELHAANATVCEQGPQPGTAMVPLPSNNPLPKTASEIPAAGDSASTGDSSTDSATGGATDGATGGSTGGSSAPPCASSCNGKPTDCSVFNTGECAGECTQTEQDSIATTAGLTCSTSGSATNASVTMAATTAEGGSATAGVDCSGPLITVATSKSDTCAVDGADRWIHAFPTTMKATDCHGWTRYDEDGKAVLNSVNNVRCTSDGLAYSQYTETLACDPTVSSARDKVFYPTGCHKGQPATLFEGPAPTGGKPEDHDLSCCTAPDSDACKAMTGVPYVTLENAEVYRNGVKCAAVAAEGSAATVAATTAAGPAGDTTAAGGTTTTGGDAGTSRSDTITPAAALVFAVAGATLL